MPARRGHECRRQRGDDEVCAPHRSCCSRGGRVQVAMGRQEATVLNTGACTVVKVSKRPLLIPEAAQRARNGRAKELLRFLVSYCASQLPNAKPGQPLNRTLCPCGLPPGFTSSAPSQNQSGRKDAKRPRGCQTQSPKRGGLPPMRRRR